MDGGKSTYYTAIDGTLLKTKEDTRLYNACTVACNNLFHPSVANFYKFYSPRDFVEFVDQNKSEILEIIKQLESCQ